MLYFVNPSCTIVLLGIARSRIYAGCLRSRSQLSRDKHCGCPFGVYTTSAHADPFGGDLTFADRFAQRCLRTALRLRAWVLPALFRAYGFTHMLTKLHHRLQVVVEIDPVGSRADYVMVILQASTTMISCTRIRQRERVVPCRSVSSSVKSGPSCLWRCI